MVHIRVAWHELARLLGVVLFYNFYLLSFSNCDLSSNGSIDGSQVTGINPINDKNGITVDIRIEPSKYLHGKDYVSTNENLTAFAEIKDEKFTNVTLIYQWSTKNKTITTDKNASKITYKFDKPDESECLKVLVFHPQNDTGTSQRDLVVRDPVKIAEPIGKLFLEHGELLDVQLKFSGTAPYKYCYRVCYDGHDSGCEPCEPEQETKAAQVQVVKYLHRVGNYTMLFVVDNIASKESKSYVVRITDTVRPHPIPIIPIVSSILAVLILLVGIALHLKFKRTIYTETADFDFIRQAHDDYFEDMWDEEHSFFQRVRYILFQARDSSANMSDSYLSSSSDRLPL